MDISKSLKEFLVIRNIYIFIFAKSRINVLWNFSLCKFNKISHQYLKKNLLLYVLKTNREYDCAFERKLVFKASCG